MASSNRHWPSMFKSKPSHHQWQHDVINNPSLVSKTTSCHRTTTSSGLEDQRTPEPKPRWNPRPEQIRILEAIFNSGMVNPPREEIRKIRAQLQEYGQVGDANVFYWFQNRKSRSKHKLRLQHINSKQQQQHLKPSLTAASSSSSSSERSSPNKAHLSNLNNKSTFSNVAATSHDVVCNMVNFPTASVNQASFFHALPNPDVLQPNESSYFFPLSNNSDHASTVVASANFSTAQGFYFSELANVVHVNNANTTSPDLHTGLLLSGIMMNNNNNKDNNNDNGIMASRNSNLDRDPDQMKGMKMNQNQLLPLNYSGATTTNVNSSPTSTGLVNVALLSPMSHFQDGGVLCAWDTLIGIGEVGGAAIIDGGAAVAVAPARLFVFINDVAYEVAAGHFNVREAFGDDAVLIHSSGQPVLTNEWGVTLHSLHHGAFYYLI